MTVSMRHAQAYRVYLNSTEWQKRREEALGRASYRCQRCRSAEMLEVHHLSYDRLGFERPEDLEVLCNPCHAYEHGRVAKNDPVVSVGEAFERVQEQKIELERLEGEQEKVLRATMRQLEIEMPREFRQILAKLELVSHGTTASWAPSGGGTGTAVFPPGEKTPPHLYWRERWLHADGEDGRTNAWKGARGELESLSRRLVVRVRGETENELAKRIIDDGEGWTVEDVAQRMRCTPTFVRKVRLKDGRRVETGIAPEKAIVDYGDKRKRAEELAASGMTERQIAMITGLPKSTLRRVLGRAA